MKLRVKQGCTAYLNERRYREGQIVEVSEDMMRKVDQGYLTTLEAERAKELGPAEAKKHGLKIGSRVLPKWAELASKPASAEPEMPGTGRQPGMPVKPGKDEEEPEGDEKSGGDQNVL